MQTQIVFSVSLATFAVVMVLAGRRLTTWGPQRLAFAGGLTLGAGYVIAGHRRRDQLRGRAPGRRAGRRRRHRPGYVVPIAVGMRWFPDHKGMITGVAVAGFGFGAMAWIKIAGSWGDLIDRIGLDGTFRVYGVAFAVLVAARAAWR